MVLQGKMVKRRIDKKIWYKVKEEYFELKEQRPDMMVQGIDPGASVIYKDDEQTLQIQVLQSEFGDAILYSELYCSWTGRRLYVPL